MSGAQRTKLDLYDWTDERRARLAELWARGLSLTRMAEEMGTTKNSVVGKVHRLKLPPRPSPIPGGRRPAPERIGRTQHSGPGAQQRLSPPSVRKSSLVAVGLAPAEAVPVAPPVVEFRRASQPCCWPMWGDRAPVPRPPVYCGTPGLPGDPYCAEHRARAWRVLVR